jgi:hypothetical protein
VHQEVSYKHYGSISRKNLVALARGTKTTLALLVVFTDATTLDQPAAVAHEVNGETDVELFAST